MGKTTQQGVSWYVLLNCYYFGDRIKNTKMGEAYSISERGEGFDGKTEWERPLGNIDSNGRIILRWSFNKSDVGGMKWIDLAQEGQKVGSCEYSNEPSGSTKSGEFLD